MADTTTSQKQDVNLVQQEQTANQQAASLPLQENVKDTDLVVLTNDQVLTTSLKVAEYFGKQHKNVMQAVERCIDNLIKINGLNFQPVKNGFIAGSYRDSKGEERPLYYLNRDAFTFVVMGFTGEKAAAWKWRYIQAFNRMEEELHKQQQDRPMTSLEILQHQVAVMTDHEQRLNSLEDDIRQLRTAHNGMSLRHEITDLKQQQQLDRHETDIADIKVTIAERSPRANIKALIEDTVRKYANTEHAVDYGHAYACFYQEVKAVTGFDVLTEYTKLQQRRKDEGWSENKVSKISKIDVIEEHPDTWSDIKALISTIREENNI